MSPPKLNAKTLSDTALACCPHLGFILVPCWTIIAHLGSILAPCWTILAPQSLPRSVLAPQKPPEQKVPKNSFRLDCILAPWGPLFAKLFYYLRMPHRCTIRCEWMPKTKKCAYFPQRQEQLLLSSSFFVLDFRNIKSSLKSRNMKFRLLLTKKSSIHNR